VSVTVGVGESVGLPIFGYKREHPETDAANTRARTAIRRFFINPD
jgi:hypothetical protein